MVGATSINDTGTAATTLNTGTNTGNVIIGNIGNTTSLNSATNNIGVNAFPTTNNIGTNAAAPSINTLGSTNVGTTVTALGGNTTLSLANNVASLTAGPTLATNGVTGTTSGTGSGGLVIYNAAQTISAGSTIPTALSPTGILAGKTYQNKVSGNLMVDGNVYINGTLDYVSSNSANTTVVGAATGTSILQNATQGTSAGTAIVMKGSTGTHTVSNVNGQLTNVTGPAAQSSASLTLTNGYGNTHGVLVTETQTIISGGTHSTSLTFDNNDVTFRNAQTGAPIQVHGVADGTSNFDAVNVRQLGAGVASVSAMTNIPQLDTGKNFAMGVGYGYHLGQSALAVGGTLRINPYTVVKSSLAVGTGPAAKPSFGVGASISW